MKHSDRWNPLQENHTVDDVQASSYVIISNTQQGKGGDDFWPKAEESLLQAFEFYFLETFSPNNNLTHIYKKIATSSGDDLADMFNNLSEDSAARTVYNSFAKGNSTIETSILTGLCTRLKIFLNEDLQRLTSQTDIDLSLPGKEPCIYYIITSDIDSSYDVIASLFYTFLFIKLIDYADSQPNGRCKNEVFFFLDEFANLGQIPDFNKKISTVRSRGVHLIPILQNLGQFNNRYPDGLSDEIMGNCDVRLGLRNDRCINSKLFLFSNRCLNS